MTTDADLDALADHFARLHAELEADHDQRHVLGLLTTAATEFLPGCSWAGAVQLDGRGRVVLLAADGEPAAAAVRVEDLAGDGPSFAASFADGPVHSPDLAAESRWPEYAEQMRTETPVRTVLSRTLADDRLPVVLTLYGERTAAFVDDPPDPFLVHARALLRLAAALTKIENLSFALTTSRLIGTAVGIVMSTHRLSSDEAFDLLRSTSETLQVKVRTLAVHIVDTGSASSLPVSR